MHMIMCNQILSYTAPPPPENEVSEEVGVTWITISWDSPSIDGNIVNYIVTAASEGDDVSVTVSGSKKGWTTSCN